MNAFLCWLMHPFNAKPLFRESESPPTPQLKKKERRDHPLQCDIISEQLLHCPRVLRITVDFKKEILS